MTIRTRGLQMAENFKKYREYVHVSILCIIKLTDLLSMVMVKVGYSFILVAKSKVYD